MAISPYRTWDDGDILTGPDLTASFARILDNATALVSPFTSSPDLNGNALVVDTDGDSKLAEVSDDVLSFRLSSTDLFKFDMSTASSVNGVQLKSSATAGDARVMAFGSDTNINVSAEPKGSGDLRIVASTGVDAKLQAAGVDAAINLSLLPKSTGNVRFGASGSAPALIFDTDKDSGIYSTSDDVLVLGLTGSVDAFKFDMATASRVNGLTFASTATGVDVSTTAQGSDTNISWDLISKGSGVIKHNGVAIPFVKTYAQNTNNDQSISAATETDVTGLTALNLPDTSSVNTKTYRVSGSMIVSETSGAGTSLATMRVYNGANGTKADTEMHRRAYTVPTSGFVTIPIGPFEFTPGNSAHTKIGVSITTVRTGTVFGNNTASQNVATLLVERVA